jgi:hypothetical protein
VSRAVAQRAVAQCVGLTGQATASVRPPQAQLHNVKLVKWVLYVLLLLVSSVIVFYSVYAHLNYVHRLSHSMAK